MDFEFIDESEIEAVSRGRKSNVSPELVEALKACPKGKAVKVSSLAGDPSDKVSYEKHKQSCGATLRSAAVSAGVKIAVSWSPNGVPQVRVMASSGNSKKG